MVLYKLATRGIVFKPAARHLPFLVKAANNDGRWNETPTELEIIILPAWYKTWWASLLFAAAFIAATVFVFRYFGFGKA